MKGRRPNLIVEKLNGVELARLAVQSVLDDRTQSDVALERQIGARARTLPGDQSERYRAALACARDCHTVGTALAPLLATLVVAEQHARDASDGWRLAAELARHLAQLFGPISEVTQTVDPDAKEELFATAQLLTEFAERAGQSANQHEDVQALVAETRRTLSTQLQAHEDALVRHIGDGLDVLPPESRRLVELSRGR